MDARIVLALLVQSLILLPGVGPDEADEATQQHMREREEMLSREMTRLLHEPAQDSPSSSTWGALPFAASQQWHIWAISAVLVLCFCLCWWLWKRCSRKKVVLEEQEQNPSVQLEVGRYASDAVLHLPASFSVVEEMTNDVLQKCRTLTKGSFKPIMQSAIPMGCATECCSPHEHLAVYRMLVPLTPPLAHSFHLERGSTGEEPWKRCRIRVELECTCERELLENRLCLLHHSEEELREQPPSLLKTLCTGSYLDMEKTARWFQGLVSLAWNILPKWKDYHLTVLPSRRSCCLQLTRTPNITFLIDMVFDVEEDDLDAIRNIE